MTKPTINFKKSESFYIRDGWFEKAINTINDNADKNIFSKNNGTSYLGIGSNMVKGLKYWLKAAGIIESSQTYTRLGELGNLILKYDKYCESSFTWYLIHFMLCTNKNECPVFELIFNSDIKSFNKVEATSFILNSLEFIDCSPKKEYVDDDFDTFIKSYIRTDEITDPENNYVCPLSSLKLLCKKGDKFQKCKPVYTTLSPLLIYYGLSILFNFNSFNIEDSFAEEGSPALIFNLDNAAYFQYLDDLKRLELITINKTAGLNTVYFEKKLSLEDVFKLAFGGE